MVFLICLIIATISAFVGAIAGFGGGIILVPTLFVMQTFFDSFAWATPQAVVGISLITMIFTSLSSTSAYIKTKRIDFRTAILFLTGSIPGGILGSWLNQFIDVEVFSLYFGMLMIFISLLLFVDKERLRRKVPKEDKYIRTFQLFGKTYRYRVTPVPAFLLSLIVGLISGLFGLGGGSIMVPAMILFFGIPTHIAIATSMFMIFFVSIVGATTHIALGHIAWEYILFFIPGAWIGGKLGAKVNQRLTGKTLEWILRILLIFVGLRMIVQGIS